MLRLQHDKFARGIGMSLENLRQEFYFKTLVVIGYTSLVAKKTTGPVEAVLN